ncbi:MAG: hypothetical protein WEA31_02445, partial [Pirellulales bacterium]
YAGVHTTVASFSPDKKTHLAGPSGIGGVTTQAINPERPNKMQRKAILGRCRKAKGLRLSIGSVYC